MPTFSIAVPDRHREPLMGMLNMAIGDGRRLSTEIEKSGGTSATIVELLSKEGVDGREAFRALVALLVLQRQSDLELVDLIESVRESLEVEAVASETGLAALLENRTLKGYAKALGLRNEYERILTDTRIVSDIRPIFDDRKDEANIRAVIVNHTIRLSFYGGDRDSHEIHFALDAADLRKLKAQVDRALMKDQASQEFMETRDVVVLEPMGDGADAN